MEHLCKFRGQNYEGLGMLYDFHEIRPNVLNSYRSFFTKILKEYSSFLKRITAAFDTFNNEWKIPDYFMELLSQFITAMADQEQMIEELKNFCDCLKTKAEELKKNQKSDAHAKYKSLGNIKETTMTLRNNVAKAFKPLEDYYSTQLVEETKEGSKQVSRMRRILNKEIEKYNNHLTTHEKIIEPAYQDIYSSTELHCDFMKSNILRLVGVGKQSLVGISYALDAVEAFTKFSSSEIFIRLHANANWTEIPSPISLDSFDEKLETIKQMKKEQVEAVQTVNEKFRRTPNIKKKRPEEISTASSVKGEQTGLMKMLKKKKDEKSTSQKRSCSVIDTITNDSEGGSKANEIIELDLEGIFRNDATNNEENKKDEIKKEEPIKRRDSFTFSDESGDDNENIAESDSDDVPKFKLVIKPKSSTVQTKSVGAGLDDLSRLAGNLKLGNLSNIKSNDKSVSVITNRDSVTTEVPAASTFENFPRSSIPANDSEMIPQIAKLDSSNQLDPFKSIGIQSNNFKICTSIPDLKLYKRTIKISFAVAEKLKYMNYAQQQFLVEGAVVMCLEQSCRQDIYDTEYMNVVIKIQNFLENTQNILFDRSCTIMSKDDGGGVHTAVLNLPECHSILSKQNSLKPEIPYHNFNCLTYQVSSGIMSEPAKFVLDLEPIEDCISVSLSYTLNPANTWMARQVDKSSIPEVSSAFITLIFEQLEFTGPVELLQNSSDTPVRFIESSKSIVWAMKSHKWEDPNAPITFVFKAKIHGSNISLNTSCKNKVSLVLAISDFVFNPLKIELENSDEVYKIGVVKYKLRFGPYIFVV